MALVKFVLFAFFIGIVSAGKIPDYIHVCKRNDPQVAQCIRKSVELLRPKLKAGIPELNVPGLEPLHLQNIVIGNGTRHFKAILSNVDVYGASDFQITELKVDVERHTFTIGVTIPELRLFGDYDVDAKILVVPIKGTGKFNGTVSNCEGQGTLKSEIVTKNGHKEFDFQSFELELKVGDYSVYLDNLSHHNPNLRQTANEVLNQNKEQFIEAAMPFVQRRVSDYVLKMARKITENLDYDEIFPEK